MDRLAWPTAVKVTVGIMVAGFVAGIVLLLVDQLELTGAFPRETGDFVRDIQAGNEWYTPRHPLFVAQGAMFAMGFAALGLLGRLLARLSWPGDSRGPILGGILLLAGGLGAAAQLLWIGALPVATSAQYCDCGFLTEEIMARLMTFNIVNGVQSALTNAALIGMGTGLVIAAGLGFRAGMPSGWALLSYATALAAVIVAVLWSFHAAPFHLTYPFNLWGLVVLAAVLVPAWAIWLALRAEGLRLGDVEVE
jgi:hypothetical protein